MTVKIIQWQNEASSHTLDEKPQPHAESRAAGNIPARLPGLVFAKEAAVETGITALPWHLAIEDWPMGNLAATAGKCHNAVRFVYHAVSVLVIKETSEHVAAREYCNLKELARLGIPCVEPMALVTGRTTLNRELLKPAMVTRHLESYKSYRALLSQTLDKDTLMQLIDAQAMLLVRLHLNGFYWGEASLSNTLFDLHTKGAPACLLHAESGKLYPEISCLQREYDLQIARINLAGEIEGLRGSIDDELDPIATSELILSSYTQHWGVTATKMNRQAPAMRNKA